MAVQRRRRRSARKPRPDFLDEIVERSTRLDPRFPLLLKAADRRRRLLERLVRIRSRKKLSQNDIADLMGTSQAEVSRIESGEIDLRSSTFERYALALGQDVHYSLVPIRA